MENQLDSHDSRVTLLALGGIAGLVSAVGHEAIGHGGACLAVGGTVTLLTATHFACSGGNVLVDAAGPLANMVLAFIGAVGLAKMPRASLEVAPILSCACRLQYLLVRRRVCSIQFDEPG